ncbi:MAG: LacI family DNA-binding transcriptional regulator [Planctomycetota bacterium]
MSVTLKQVANRAGVSPSTAARILRGDVKGSQDRSARKVADVIRASDELGYQPNWKAAALSRGKTHSIGLLFSEPEWIFGDPTNEIAVAFTRGLQRRGYDLRLIPCSSSDNEWERLVLGGALDGVAFLLEPPSEAVLEAVRKAKLPTLSMGIDACEARVMPDDARGAYAATRHLISLGHERIDFYVETEIRDHVSVIERREGYERAMREAGLGDQIEPLRCGIKHAVDRLLREERTTAVVAYSHFEGVQLAHSAWAHGISVPTDLSIIAFNDVSVAKYATPPLTIVDFDRQEMGRIGADLLLDQIESDGDTSDGGTPAPVVMPQQLVIRGSTAPAKSA